MGTALELLQIDAIAGVCGWNSSNDASAAIGWAAHNSPSRSALPDGHIDGSSRDGGVERFQSLLRLGRLANPRADDERAARRE